MSIRDARSITDRLRLDEQGFERIASIGVQ
jgi:hypothetical protein